MILIIPLALILFFVLFANRITKGFRLAWILASLSISFLILFSTEILSLFTQLNQTALIIFWVSIVIITLTLLIGKKISFPRFSWNVFENRFLNYASLIVPIGLFAATFVIAIVSPPNNTDAMVYHLSRVAHWAQNQSVANFPTSTLRELYLNPFAEYGLLQTYLLSGSDRFVNLVQWFSYFNIAILVSLITCKLGGGKKGQYFAAIFALSLPQALLQATTTQNDLVFSSMVLMSAFFLICFIEESKTLWLIPAAIASSLAVLSKSTAFIVLSPFLVWALVRILKQINKKMVLYSLVSLVAALAIMFPFYLRNWSSFGNPLGPSSETDLYRNEKIGFQPIISNSLRNFAINLTYTQKTSEFEEKIIQRIHTLFKWDTSDPATSWQDYKFSIPGFMVNEDTSGNPIHVWLALLVVVMVFVNRSARSKSVMALVLCVLIGYLLFSLLLKWQPWNNRLQTVFFLLIAPLFGFIFDNRKISSLVISGILIISTVPYFLFNPTKPITQDWNIFNLSRVESMIRNDEIIGPYVRGSNYIEDTPCARFGMNLSNGYWEYPLWYLLVDPISPNRTLQHVNVENESASFSRDGNVCGVIVVNANTKPPIFEVDNQEFELSFVEEPLGIYLLPTP